MRNRRRRALRIAALAAGSVALAPFIGSAGPSVGILNSAGQQLSVSGRPAEQQRLSPEVLAHADDPEALARMSGLPWDVPLVPLGAPDGRYAGGAGIPATPLAAYRTAERSLAGSAPDCRLPWSLVASIGRIESGHARGGHVDQAGRTYTPILGPVLNGAGFAAIRDNDGGVLDGDPVWDRAVGPMQFIPGTWRGYASDGNGDGLSDPHNVFDAAVAAGRYLCSGGENLADPGQRAHAVFRYNQSDAYVRTVLLWADAYARGASAVPDGTGYADGYGYPAGNAAAPAAPAPVAPPPAAPAPPSVPPPAPPPPGTNPAPPPVDPPKPPVTTTTTTTTQEPDPTTTTPAEPTCTPPTTTEPPSTTPTTPPCQP